MQEWAHWDEPFPVRPGEVHLFGARLDGLDGVDHAVLRATLAGDELERAGRFASAVDRERFVAAHGFLRLLLARCLGVEPRRIAFARGAYGKPCLAEAHSEGWLRFNMSVSRGVALYVVARDREVGVDVEYRGASPVNESLLAIAFSAAERARFDLLPPALKHETFFDCWTRKEACLKARARGLTVPPDRCEVPFGPGELPALLDVEGEVEAHRYITLFECSPGRDYSAACAVDGTDARLMRPTHVHATPAVVR